MSISVVVFVVFVALASMFGVVVLAARDLLFSRGGAGTAESAPHAGPTRLRRLPHPDAQTPPAHPLETFDRWFGRLVKDTGLPWTSTVGTLWLVFCGAIVGAALFVFNEQPLTAIVGVSLGMAAALAYLMVRRARHVRLLQDQLPTALDMLARSMRAGQSLDQAVELVGRQSPDPLAAEFRFCAKQLAMGLSMPAVMRSLVDRVRLFDVRIFTAALSVHRRTGGNIAKVLERLARVIRDRLNYRRQLRAVTGAGRLSAILIGMIGPLLFIYMSLFQPQYLQTMMESPLGQSLLISAVVLEVIGIVWTIRLLRPVY